MPSSFSGVYCLYHWNNAVVNQTTTLRLVWVAHVRCNNLWNGHCSDKGCNPPLKGCESPLPPSISGHALAVGSSPPLHVHFNAGHFFLISCGMQVSEPAALTVSHTVFHSFLFLLLVTLVERVPKITFFLCFDHSKFALSETLTHLENCHSYYCYIAHVPLNKCCVTPARDHVL